MTIREIFSSTACKYALYLIFSILFGISCIRGSNNDDEDSALIFAAASLSEVLTEVAEMYKNATGKTVEFSFGGSTALANQIALSGSPADGVFLVGQTPLEVLRMGNVIGDDDHLYMFTNTLVLIGHKDVDKLVSLQQLGSNSLRLGAGRAELRCDKIVGMDSSP